MSHVTSTGRDAGAGRHRFLDAPRRFLRTEFHGGAFLLLAALVALAWANAPGDSHARFWQTEAGFDLGFIAVSMDYRHWVNDALMVIVFFVIGLEIKREMAEGDLLTPQRAVLPAAGALGGMLVAALVFLSFNSSGPESRGWAIPTSTDIGFSIAVLALAARSISFHLRVFLLTLATVDDLAIVIVVALFFAGELSAFPLAGAAVLLAVVLILKRADVTNLLAYASLGVLLWLAVLHSGVHPTIVGAVLGLLTPVSSHFSAREFERRRDELTQRYETALNENDTSAQETALEDLEALIRKAESPEKKLERSLVPVRNLAIMPLFALANAGITIDLGVVEDAVRSPVAHGIFLGLVFGKPLGVFVFAWLAARAGIARLPEDTRWREIFALSFLTGIGFTVSLFVTTLALDEGGTAAESATLAIFAASILASIIGWTLVRMVHSGAAARAEPPGGGRGEGEEG